MLSFISGLLNTHIITPTSATVSAPYLERWMAVLCSSFNRICAFSFILFIDRLFSKDQGKKDIYSKNY